MNDITVIYWRENSKEEKICSDGRAKIFSNSTRAQEFLTRKTQEVSGSGCAWAKTLVVSS